MTRFDTTEDSALELDRLDPLGPYRERFCLPEGVIYLLGNSLGLLSKDAEASLQRVLSEWKELAIRGWLEASEPWFTFAERLGERAASLVGAAPEDVVATGTTTVNIHALVSAFYEPRGARRRILADELDFPSDLYALQSQVALRGLDPERDLVLVPSRDARTIEEEDVIERMTEEVALVFLPSVLYRSGQLLDMARLTREAHERGIPIGFDCCHSAGVVRHAFDEWGVDFATWCGYKYLNAGPGSSAFLYVNGRHASRRPRLAGWFGFVKERQFEMLPRFEPQPGARGFQISSPGILGSAPLEGALDLILRAGPERIEAKSRQATAYLIHLVDELLTQPPYDFRVGTPREPHRRGGHVALHRGGGAHRIAAALEERGVIVDYRPPDVLRIAPAALYNTFHEIWRAVHHIREIVDSGEHASQEDTPAIIP